LDQSSFDFKQRAFQIKKKEIKALGRVEKLILLSFNPKKQSSYQKIATKFT